MLPWRSLTVTACAFLLFSLTTCFLQLSKADTNPSNNVVCNPSYCGGINISFPFRLSTDPPECGSRNFQLACNHQNRTIIHAILNAADYYFYVEDINYHNLTMRVVDSGIHKHNCSSFPLYSLPMKRRRIAFNVDIDEYLQGSLSFTSYFDIAEYQIPVTFLRCAAPINKFSSLRIVQVPAICNNNNSNNNIVDAGASSPSPAAPALHYSYVLSGVHSLSHVPDSCTIGATTRVPNSSWPINHTPSFISLHRAMEFGIQLSWENCYCSLCTSMENILCRTDSCERYQDDYHPPTLSQRIGYFFAGLPHFLGNNYPAFLYWLLARFLLGFPYALGFLVYKFWRRHLSMYDNIEDFLQSQTNLMPINYSYYEIKNMTNKFRDKLGEGGFGSVYKGKQRSSSEVAVKMLDNSKANGQDLINEIATIGRIHHVNVVQLVGFCIERSKRALVYDFMPNGSLEKHIFCKEGEVSMSWKKLYEISLGVARGIEYLHKGCDMQILHFDIKPHNILLDENFIPKISDFGLAKLYGYDDSIVSLTMARGTMGYMAPELFYKNIGGVSYKADVYSYGMLLMEMAGRRKNLNAFADQLSQIYFPSWAYDQMDEGKDMEIEGATEEEKAVVKKMIIVGLWCIQMNPSHRPSMSRVVEMLEGNTQVLEMPPKPCFTPREMPTEVQRMEPQNQTEPQASFDNPNQCIDVEISEDTMTEI